ncbi:BTAD domain-containing putative transcriptional regulator [Sanguibacter suaedae]|uniref:BTAD domain-containing putative transcriptional regulator n=1 Tax=Sanguibacter suaedae TaxID=2795737 RepID=UPI0018E6C379|nr:BTAD domain-containing putative transcriptional regulator [Sanguibacter suaedae]
MHLQILGDVSVVGPDGTSSSLSSAQAQIAAARLVLERRRSGTSRLELASTIWPETLPDTWASALRGVVTRVRRLLEEIAPDVSLESVGGRYVLRLPPTVVVDLEDARSVLTEAGDHLAEGRTEEAREKALRALIALERGFLPDHDCEWANTVRQEVADSRVDAHDIAAHAALSLGDEAGALRSARALIDVAPLRESGYRVLMEAHLGTGNRGEALAVFARLRTMLSDELGIDPSPETEELYFRILSTGSDGARPAPARSRQPRRRPFVARTGVLDELTQAWEAVAPGEAALCLVTGELGLGKTSVANEFARRVAQLPATVITCAGRTVDRQHSAVVKAVGDHLPALDPEVRATVEPLVRAAERAVRDDGVHAVRLMEAALREVTAGGPSLVVVDDIDEADPTTLGALRAFFRDTSGGPGVLLLATAESARLDAARLRVLHDLGRHGTTRRIDLPRFGLLDAHELVSTLPAATRENAAQLGRLVTASGGNPYLLARLVESDPDRHDVMSTVVDGMRDYTRIRTAALSTDASRLLRVAAVAGPVFDVDVVARACGVAPEDVADTLAELERAELVACDDHDEAAQDGHRSEDYHFVHGAVCDAIYAELPKTERVRLHRRISEQLAQLETAALSDSRCEVFARTSTVSTAPDRLDGPVRVRWRAADVAEELGDRTEAVRLRAQVLELVEQDEASLRAEALNALGTSELRAGLASARGHLLRAALLGTTSGAVGAGLCAASTLVDDLAADPRTVEDARSTSDQVVEHLALVAPATFDDPDTGRHLARFLARHARTGTTAGPPELLRRAVRSLAELTEESTHPRDAAHRAALARELADLATAAGDVDALVVAAHHGSSAAAVRHCPDEMREFGRRWADALAAHPDPARYAHLSAERDLVAAVGAAAFGDDAPPGPTPGTSAPPPLPAALPVALAGDLRGRQRLVARWLGFRHPSVWSPAAGEAPPPTSFSAGGAAAWVDACLADVLADRLPSARSRLRMMMSLDLPVAVDDSSLHDAAVLAIVAVATGDTGLVDETRRRIAPVALVAAGHGYRTSVGPMSFHLARLAAAEGDFDDAERLLHTGLSSVSRAGSRVWVAAHQLVMASVLDRRRTPGDTIAARSLREEARGIVSPRVVTLAPFDPR